MNQCQCGSYAINTHCHGRTPGVDLELCDVCYWRTRAEGLEKERAEMLATWKHFRLQGSANGLTLREMAKILNISPVTLSSWTSEIPTTEPDFVELTQNAKLVE
jgi:hypothetical protein